MVFATPGSARLRWQPAQRRVSQNAIVGRLTHRLPVQVAGSSRHRRLPSTRGSSRLATSRQIEGTQRPSNVRTGETEIRRTLGSFHDLARSRLTDALSAHVAVGTDDDLLRRDPLLGDRSGRRRRVRVRKARGGTARLGDGDESPFSTGSAARCSGSRISRSIARRLSCSCDVQNETAVPAAPARPVRPIRCTYVSGSGVRS